MRFDFLLSAVQGFQHGVGDGHIVKGDEDNQAGKRKKEVEWQCHHAGHIVHVENTALLTFMAAESKQFTENLTVYPYTRNKSNQHKETGNAHNEKAEKVPVNIQAVMQRIEPFTPDFKVMIRDTGASTRIDRGIAMDMVVTFSVGRKGNPESRTHT